MLARIPERNIPMMRCVVESNLQDFVVGLNDRVEMWQGEEVFQQLNISADWIAICRRELDSPQPNTPNLYAPPVCWKCGANKHLLRTDWLKDPFHWHDDCFSTLDFPNAIFDQIYHFLLARYCLMHGLTNLLANSLIGLHDLLPLKSSQRHTFHNIVQTTIPKWKPAKTTSAKGDEAILFK